MATTTSALPDNYATLAGLVWLAILVTAGARSNVAALVAGFTFTFFPRRSSLAYLYLVACGPGASALCSGWAPSSSPAQPGGRARLQGRPRSAGWWPGSRANPVPGTAVAIRAAPGMRWIAALALAPRRAVPVAGTALERSGCPEVSGTGDGRRQPPGPIRRRDRPRRVHGDPALEACDVTVRFGGLKRCPV